jgi:hypothetical protein
MSLEPLDPLEIIWDGLLSREPDLVRSTFAALDPGSQREALDHLRKMASEPDWHPEQRTSALAALAALEAV